MTAFIQGTRSVGISGGNFRQASYSEQHEHHTRVYREDKTVIQGNIYGYTHTATSDDGPIIAYSHTTNVTRPHYDENYGQSFRSVQRGDPSTRQTHNLPSNTTDPRVLYQILTRSANALPSVLGDGTEHLSHNRDSTVERRPAFLLPQTEHQTSEPLADLDDHELKAEFHTMSPEMQRYVGYMRGQLEKSTASGGTVKTMDATPIARASGSTLVDLKPSGNHSDSGLHEPRRPITPSPQIDSHLSDHEARGTQSSSGVMPSTVGSAANKIQEKRLGSTTEVPPGAPNNSSKTKASLMKSLGTLGSKAHRLSRILTRSSKSRVE